MSAPEANQPWTPPQEVLKKFEDMKLLVDAGFFTDHPLPRSEFKDIALEFRKAFSSTMARKGWKKNTPGGFWEQVMGRNNISALRFRALLRQGLTYEEQLDSKRLQTDQEEESIALMYFSLGQTAETLRDPLALHTLISRVIRRTNFLGSGEALSTFNPRVTGETEGDYTWQFIKHLSDPYHVAVRTRMVDQRLLATGFTVFYEPPSCRG